MNPCLRIGDQSPVFNIRQIGFPELKKVSEQPLEESRVTATDPRNKLAVTERCN
jgi:hypothetical protein